MDSDKEDAKIVCENHTYKEVEKLKDSKKDKMMILQVPKV